MYIYIGRNFSWFIMICEAKKKYIYIYIENMENVMKHFSRSSWFASHRRHWFSLKKFIPSNLLSNHLLFSLLGDILLLIRDDCRCNYRNSCSVDVRSDIFEEDPCPGTGKYIEAQYYCLGWCTHKHISFRLRSIVFFRPRVVTPGSRFFQVFSTRRGWWWWWYDDKRER